jgi:type I restriction enzyme S subunit
MGGSAGQQRVQSDFFTNFRVPRLAPDEQSCVAAVLDTIDEAITQAEAVIAKLRQVRTGLFQSLLTCGLDHNGQLRTPAAQPQQFKDSLVGLIPKAWEELTLRACLFAPPQNGIYKPPREIGRGALLIGQTSITLDRSIDLALARRAEATEEECARYGLRAGDLLISRVFATLDGVGQPALVPSLPEDAVYESNMMRLRPRLEIISPTILFHWLRMPRVRSFLISRANLSNQASVNQEALNSLPVFAPPPDEQEAIVAAISSYDENCRIQNEELAKLRAFKSGLMTDLLTGRVPVPKSIGGSP